MGKMTDIALPDIGDFHDVEVIEILVAVGDTVAVEDSLMTLESDKATMEIPSPMLAWLAKCGLRLATK
jgi:pyruvate dehydrogenase E2 component (dihydrolipoamide acetyltransferase)